MNPHCKNKDFADAKRSFYAQDCQISQGSITHLFYNLK